MSSWNVKGKSSTRRVLIVIALGLLATEAIMYGLNLDGQGAWWARELVWLVVYLVMISAFYYLASVFWPLPDGNEDASDKGDDT